MNAPILQFGTPPAEARAALIFLHGRGSSGDDAALLAQSIPTDDVAWLAPSAPGGSWYPQRFLVPPEQNEPHLSAALQTLDSLIENLQSAGLPPERIALTGFSQGACLALEYAARNPRRYGFVAVLSGALIGPLDTQRPPVDLKQTPILLGCADHDSHIPLEFVESSHRFLETANAAVTRQRFPGPAHTIFPQEIDWMRQALANLAPRT